MRSKLSVTVYLFLDLYGSTTLQSRSFLKNIENFFVKKMIPYKTYVQEKHAESILGTRKNMTKKVFNLNTYRLTVMTISQKYRELSMQGFLFLRNTLLLYSLSPYGQTESLTEE